MAPATRKLHTWITDNNMNYKEIPKVEMYCHKEVCFRPPTVMEVGVSPGLDTRNDPDQFCREWLLSETLRDLVGALKRFVDIQIRGFV